MRQVARLTLFMGLLAAGYGWSQVPSALEADARGWQLAGPLVRDGGRDAGHLGDPHLAGALHELEAARVAADLG